jgi:hypothetical protein
MSDGLTRYLRDGPAQRRLVAEMANGHARKRHGRELGAPDPVAFAARVRTHLRTAPLAVAVGDGRGQTRYLLADRSANQVAWITPHREHRSTLFAPRQGVDSYLRARQVASPPGRWVELELGSIRQRARSPGRAGPSRVASASRAPAGSELTL